MESDIKYWLAMDRIKGLGPARFKKLYSYFNTMELAWRAQNTELMRAGLEGAIAKRIIQERRKINPDEEMAKIIKEGVAAVTIKDTGYPRLLREIYSPPGVIYYRGKLQDKMDEYALGVVGTRKYSAYGKQVVDDLIDKLVKSGIVMVSGLALGIDTLVHEMSVKQDKRTVAVLGAGVESKNIYPGANRKLADKIIDKGGLIMSEYAPGTRPEREHFPQRNRIIAGLTRASLVVEAPERSGALITARFAVEFNREVLAVPGDIYSENAGGVNRLIKLGARAVSRAEEVLEVFKN